MPKKSKVTTSVEQSYDSGQLKLEFKWHEVTDRGESDNDIEINFSPEGANFIQDDNFVFFYPEQLDQLIDKLGMWQEGYKLGKRG